MERSRFFVGALLVSLCFTGIVATVRAAITTTGNVRPTNPDNWTSSTNGYIGNTSDGTLTLDAGSHIASNTSYLGYNSGVSGQVTVSGTNSHWYNSGSVFIGNSGSGAMYLTARGQVNNMSASIGYNSGSTGVVTVDGTGSTWMVNRDLYVGYSGDGTLNINHDGQVFVDSGATYVAYQPGSTGIINFGSDGGKLYTDTLFASPSQLKGTGLIRAFGLVSDNDLIFDATHDLLQTFWFNSQPNQNIRVNLNVNLNQGPALLALVTLATVR